MCVKGSNNSCPNSTILYNYQFVFIETISDKCQAHSTPSIGGCYYPLPTLEVSHFPCQPLLYLYSI